MNKLFYAIVSIVMPICAMANVAQLGDLFPDNYVVTNESIGTSANIAATNAYVVASNAYLTATNAYFTATNSYTIATNAETIAKANSENFKNYVPIIDGFITATNINGVVIGKNASASTNSYAIGNDSTTKLSGYGYGTCAVALGCNASAIGGSGSMALGYNASAAGSGVIALGADVKSDGYPKNAYTNYLLYTYQQDRVYFGSTNLYTLLLLNYAKSTNAVAQMGFAKASELANYATTTALSDEITRAKSAEESNTTAAANAQTSADTANSAIATHVADKSNPHAVTAAQVGAATTAALADEASSRAAAVTAANDYTLSVSNTLAAKIATVGSSAYIAQQMATTAKAAADNAASAASAAQTTADAAKSTADAALPTNTAAAVYATKAALADYLKSVDAASTYLPLAGGTVTGNLRVNGGVATGSDTTANGSYSHAEGFYTAANGSYSHAEGNSTSANGSYSHAEGSGTTTQGDYSHAEGYYSHAEGYASHAEGTSTSANGPYSHAEGIGTTAAGPSSHAEGIFAHANQDYAFAWNGDTGIESYNSHGTGTFNLNPLGGISGLWIGETNLQTYLSTALTAESAARVAGDLAASNNVTAVAASTLSSAKSYTDSATNAVAFDGYDIVDSSPKILPNSFAFNRSLRSYHNTYNKSSFSGAGGSQVLENYAFYYAGRCTNVTLDSVETWTSTTCFTGLGCDLTNGEDVVVSLPNYRGTVPAFDATFWAWSGSECKITRLDIPMASAIANGAFSGNAFIREVNFSTNIVKIDDCFRYCICLVKIGDLSSCKIIVENSMIGCTNLESDLTIPNVEVVGTHAICGDVWGLSSIKSPIITTLSCCTNLGTGCFLGCTNFVSSLNFNNSLRVIPANAFCFCQITNVISWGGVTNVGATAFRERAPISIPSFSTNALGESITFASNVFLGTTVTARDGTTL